MDLEEGASIKKVSDFEVICDGKVTLRRLNSTFNTKIPEEEDVLAGYLLKEHNGFPEEGEMLERDQLAFEILETKGRTISKVRIKKL
ncbi:transporter associated domain-containing protein [Sinobaca sp. H24]|uniref:transporter associated domain-containing protein n=1 Tax=Sinobaca sp. H24 TaxID=2923376 RepID=UPI0027E32B17|nr:transporter associated domain-containing protein [Sinobaca sp. H24]